MLAAIFDNFSRLIFRAKSLEKKPKKKSKKKAAAAEDGDKEEEPRWAEVVVDLLLSLLSQDRHALRQVVRSVTSLLCPHMTNNSLQSVMDVVGGKDEEDSGKSSYHRHATANVLNKAVWDFFCRLKRRL